MGADRLTLCFGVHNHQPVGQFDHVLVEATARAYRPFLQRLAARPEVRLSAHWTGSLLEWLRERSPATFDLLGSLVARGQVELLTGGFYEPILAILPDHDKIGQIERLTDFIKSNFGVRPRGMWLAERVWEPHLPRAIREAGVEYVLVDDRHFALAGLDAETIGGYYLTEDQGAVLAVFPISQRLRYLIPFAEVDASLEYLAGRRGTVPALTVVDDGEKFGVWPGTHAHVYESGWLDRFFDRLLTTPGIALATLSEILDRVPAVGRVYLPTASYREMGEWALPLEAARDLERIRHDLTALPQGPRAQDWLHGGFWRAFLVRYPEVADTYWKMLRLSHAIHREAGRRGVEGPIGAARIALWRGQANDAYWHGVFGGCYLPHLRRGVRGALLDAERRFVKACDEPGLAWVRGDLNGDGREEIVVRTPALVVTLNPDAGGTLTELGFLPLTHDLADVLARRPEIYHDQVRAGPPEAPPSGAVRTIHAPAASLETGLDALLQYDDQRRASLIEGLFDEGEPLDAVSPWSAARMRFGADRFRSRIGEARDGTATVDLRLDAGVDRPLSVDKRVTVGGSTVTATYGLLSSAALRGRWAVQWNLALTAGEGPHRYLALPGRPPLRSRGREAGLTSVTLVDEWLGLEARLAWTPAGELGWGPIETVSVSEAGFERIYQGTAFLIVWTLGSGGASDEPMTTSLTLTAR